MQCFCRANAGEEAGYNARDIQLVMHPSNGPLDNASASLKEEDRLSPKKEGQSVPIQALAVDF